MEKDKTRAKRRERDNNKTNKKKDIANNTFGNYYIDNDGVVKHYWKKGRVKKFLKKYSNRKVRRHKGILKGGQYKRKFDYWWSLW